MGRQLIEFTPESLAEYLEGAIDGFMEGFYDEKGDTERTMLIHAAVEQLSTAYPPIHLKEGEYFMAGEGRNPASYGLNDWTDEEVDDFTYALLITKGFDAPPLQVQHEAGEPFVWSIVTQHLDDEGIKCACRDFPDEASIIAWAEAQPDR